MSILCDATIDELFRGTNFGDKINNSSFEKRKQLKKTLQNQIDGYWSGHTAYNIVVKGGLLIDGKQSSKKELTPVGYKFLYEN